MRLARSRALGLAGRRGRGRGARQRYKGRPCGGDGLLAALSFNGNKIVTTGGGGAILTTRWLGRARQAPHTTAKLPHRWNFIHDEVGYNYRLPNLNAALGVAPSSNSSMASWRRSGHSRTAYAQRFRRCSGSRVRAEPRGTTSNYWLNAILLDEASTGTRDAVLTATSSRGFARGRSGP